ncbi:MAG: FAD-dependent oxidoreductase [bacterium]|nr:FAD-dependent oxidoreductase [bacterium]
MLSDLRNYVVRSKREEVPGVVTLLLSEESGGVPAFIAGQYINVYFPETRTPEGKAYSISNAPGESEFSLTVRAIGEFSNRLCNLAIGDKVTASLPYGFFTPEKEESELVMLAAGIGVAPFRSIIRDAAARAPRRPMALFHSVRTSSDAIFQKEFENLREKLPSFSLAYFITREESPAIPDALPQRMTADDILPRILNLDNAEFLICGSISFTRDLWRTLRKAGVSEDKMYTEAFFSH